MPGVVVSGDFLVCDATVYRAVNKRDCFHQSHVSDKAIAGECIHFVASDASQKVAKEKCVHPNSAKLSKVSLGDACLAVPLGLEPKTRCG